MPTTLLKFGSCYQQMIYTRKENIDFDLPCFHSGTCLMCLEGQERPNEREREEDSRSLFLANVFVRIIARGRICICSAFTLSFPVHCLADIDEHGGMCALSCLHESQRFPSLSLSFSFLFFIEQYAFDYFQVLICVFVFSLSLIALTIEQQTHTQTLARAHLFLYLIFVRVWSRRL